MSRRLSSFALLLAVCAASSPGTIESLIDQNRLAEARQQLEAEVQAGGEDARRAFLRAMILHKEKRHRESLEVLAAFESELKERADFHKLAGLNLVELRAQVQAGPHFTRACELAPKDAMARYYLGLWLLNMRQPAAAEAALRESLRLDSRYRDSYLMLGLALEEQGRSEEALAAYGKAGAHLNAGRLLANLERYPESVGQLRAATRADPASLEAFLELGKSLEHTGQSEAALRAFEQGAKLDPKDRRIRYRLMRLNQQLGRAEDAARARRGLRIN